MSIDPSDYHIFHPRPVYLVVVKKNHSYNVMAASWVSPVSEEPPLVVIALDKSSYTRQLVNIGSEVTINIVGEEHAEIVYKAGTISGRNVDKWKLLNLEPVDSKKISVPGIKGAYGFAEGIVKNIVEAGECDLVIVEILNINVKSDLYEKYGWNLRKARILMHVRGRVFSIPGKLVFVKK